MVRFSGPRDWSSPAMRRLVQKLISERLGVSGRARVPFIDKGSGSR